MFSKKKKRFLAEIRVNGGQITYVFGRSQIVFKFRVDSYTQLWNERTLRNYEKQNKNCNLVNENNSILSKRDKVVVLTVYSTIPF